MPLYNNKVIKSDAANTKAMDYKAKDIKSGLSKEVIHFEKKQQEAASSFRMDPILAKITGHASIQEEKLKTEVEKQALEKLKEVEERAYKEAYDLGVKEGMEKGIKDAQNLIEEKLFHLEKEIEHLADLRPKLMEHNEAKILDLIYGIASKIAMKNIAEDQGYIVDLLKKLASGIQEQLETTVKISQPDYDFIQEMGDTFKRQVKIPKNAKIEVDESLNHGECIVETNYGVVDASMEGRLEKLWSVIEDTMPKSFSEGA